ncbi:hypothetical protein Tco_0191319 [Tanacetum coccineum]
MNYFLLDLPLRDDSLLSLYIRCPPQHEKQKYRNNVKEKDYGVERFGQSNNWSDVLSLIYQLFTQELEASPGWVVNKDKSIEYLQELVQRDEEMVQRLQALEREVEERADEKMLFIEKLKGNVPF